MSIPMTEGHHQRPLNTMGWP